MRTITNILRKIARRETKEDIMVDLIGSKISTPEEGFALGKFLAEQSPENACEILGYLSNIRERCNNYLNSYETDASCYGKSTARRNSDHAFRKEASRLVDYVDRIRPRIIGIKYGLVA
jgi:hypothetical protein